MGARWFSQRFYRVAAICSLVSVASTLVLIFMPPMWSGIQGDARMALARDPAYQAYIHIYFIHPFLVFVAALAVAERLRHYSTACAALGLAAFALWAATEAGQQALTIFANNEWRLAYLKADEQARAALKVQMATYRGIWDAMYFLIIVAFFLANALLAAAAFRAPETATRALAFALAAMAVLTALLISPELKGPALPDALGKWLYPLIGPPARLYIAWWLWREASRARAPA